jgi:hypothetical protein
VTWVALAVALVAFTLAVVGPTMPHRHCRLCGDRIRGQGGPYTTMGHFEHDCEDPAAPQALATMRAVYTRRLP